MSSVTIATVLQWRTAFYGVFQQNRTTQPEMRRTTTAAKLHPPPAARAIQQNLLQGFSFDIHGLKQYYFNYAIIMLPVIRYEGENNPWPILATHYVLLSFLMGGISTLDALSNLKDDDDMAPPIPSELVSWCNKDAAVAVPVNFLIAFGGAYWFHHDDNDHYHFCKIWRIYAAFIIVNLLYSFGLRNTQWRWCNAVTSALHLWLGLTILDLQRLARPHWFILLFLGAGTMQSLKLRLEKSKTGTAINPVSPQDSYLELLFCCTLFGVLFVVPFLEPTYYILHMLLGFFFLVFFAVLPWFDPISYPLAFYDIHVAAGPKKCAPFWRVAWALLRYGSLKDLIVFCAICLAFFLNILFMGIEDLFLNKELAKLMDDGSNVAFILGHPRSGSTSLHATLNKHPQVTCTPMLHSFSPSLTLQFLLHNGFWPIVSLILSCLDSGQHRYSVDQSLDGSSR
jgi:hypothetical protein